MARLRKSYGADFKAKVAIAAIKAEATTNELTAQYGVHGSQINSWKRQALEGLPGLLSDRRGQLRAGEHQALVDELYRQIGQLKVELDWLKKSLDWPVEEKRGCVEPGHADISLARQCELIGLNQSSYYYPGVEVDDLTLGLMRLLDEQYTRTPFYGVLRMTAYLRRLGHGVNPKRVRRLLRLMGLGAVYPKPNPSQAHPGHKTYPYLLRGVDIDRPHQVWSSDITYIRLRRGFVYLMAVIDWFSRYVLDWSISTTLEADFCVETLERVLSKGRCEIFNTDQGAQFTSPRFTDPLIANGVQVSMDGRGRALDNIFVERLWRSVKYEKVYLTELNTVAEAKTALAEYFTFYNTERLHQALAYRTPHEAHYAITA